MFKLFSNLKSESLARLFIVQQLVLLFIGLAFAFSSLLIVRDLESKTEFSVLKSKVLPTIERKADDLRTWHSFGLTEAVNQEFTMLKSEFPFLKISIVSRLNLPPKLSSREFVIPDFQDKELDSYILVGIESPSSLESFIKAPATYIVTIAILIVVITNLFLSTHFFTRRVYLPLLELKTFLKAPQRPKNQISKTNDEIGEFIDDIVRITDENSALQIAREELGKQAAIGTLAAQVSHDIRSPLSALNLVVSTLANLPEEKRILIRSSVNRINDIANDLLCKSKNNSTPKLEGTTTPTTNVKIEMLSALVDMLISEKRIQIRDKFNVGLEVDLSNSYGSFIFIDSTELKRVLSNLVNNSLDALAKRSEGIVKVQVRYFNKESFITIQDNGQGIAPEVLPLLGRRGFSYEKNETNTGSGLGLYHAKSTIESAGGSFRINSIHGEGTTVTVTLPNAKCPEWFVDSLSIEPNQTIIICDDDSSIHELWKGRFYTAELQDMKTEVKHFTSAEQFSLWQSRFLDLSKTLYLMDYELLDSSRTGLDLIEEFNLRSKAILVTSRYEEESIQQRCRLLGVKIIPKGMAGFIPIKAQSKPRRWDCILIDDDELIRSSWNYAAKAKGISFLAFSGIDEFWLESQTLDKSSPIFVDVNLGQDIRGEHVASRLTQYGFLNVSLATGYELTAIDQGLFSGPIIGKDFPY